MLLVRIFPDKPGCDQHTYECPRCADEITEIVQFVKAEVFADRWLCLPWRRRLPKWRLAVPVTAWRRFHENGRRVSRDGGRMFQVGA